MKALLLALCLVALAALAGCARSRSLVVLLPDPDGQVGAIRVETSQGFIALDKSYQAVAVTENKTPESTRLMTRQEVDVTFDRALATEASQRFRFKKQTFYCRRNSTDLTPESEPELPKAIQRLVATPPEEIFVVGHADRVGTESYNQQLSHKRALVVKRALVSNGINSKVIVVSFLGESKPRIVTPDEVEEPRNRRVELILKYTKSD